MRLCLPALVPFVPESILKDEVGVALQLPLDIALDWTGCEFNGRGLLAMGPKHTQSVNVSLWHDPRGCL